MNNGAFGENFPYSNFHDLNMDWIIKIVKDFLDQYTAIQNTITDGETSIETATENGIEEIQTAGQEQITELEQDATRIIQELIDSIPADFESFLDDYENLRAGLTSNNVRVVWTDNAYYDTSSGQEQSSARYAHTNMLPKYLLRFFPNWNKDKGTSYISLFNNGTYVGYMTQTLETNLTYTDFVINVYKTDYVNYENSLSVGNLYTTFNLIDSFVTAINNFGWVEGKFISTSDGTEVTDSRYVHSIMFPKYYLKYFYNWNPSKTTSYISLYKNGTYVGYMTGTLDSALDYDSVILNIYKTDYPEYTKTVELLNYNAIAKRIYNVQDGYTYIPVYQSGTYDQNSGEFVPPSGGNYICTTEPIPANIEALMINWNYNSGVSYQTLYNNGEFVGTRYNGNYYNPAGTAVNQIIYDSYHLNIYTADTSVANVKILSNQFIYTSLNHLSIYVTNPSQLINAVQTAIDNESKGYTYDITLNAGTYELWSVLDKDEIYGTGDQLYHRGLELPDRCNLYGRGTTTIVCTIPETDNSAEHPYTLIVSTLNMHNTNNIIKNIHFVGNNTRYCVHDDSGFNNPYRELLMENCTFTHNGTESETYMPSPRCYGAGYITGRVGVFRNCNFVGNNNCNTLFYVHTHSGDNNKSNCYTTLENCAFLSSTDRAIDYQVPNETSFGGYLTINNCYFATRCYIETRGVSPCTVYGGGNSDGVTFLNNNNAISYLVSIKHEQITFTPESGVTNRGTSIEQNGNIITGYFALQVTGNVGANIGSIPLEYAPLTTQSFIACRESASEVLGLIKIDTNGVVRYQPNTSAPSSAVNIGSSITYSK